MPDRGDVFTDIRGEDRTMRVSVHEDVGMVVVSLWAGRICRASFRMAMTEITRLQELLAGVSAPPDSEAGAGEETTGRILSAVMAAGGGIVAPMVAGGAVVVQPPSGGPVVVEPTSGEAPPSGATADGAPGGGASVEPISGPGAPAESGERARPEAC